MMYESYLNLYLMIYFSFTLFKKITVQLFIHLFMYVSVVST